VRRAIASPSPPIGRLSCRHGPGTYDDDRSGEDPPGDPRDGETILATVRALSAHERTLEFYRGLGGKIDEDVTMFVRGDTFERLLAG